ncbi:MAG: barstar family protein [Acholeplasmataceae bacterium]|jgi:RNAse (barnase) inhibitor barstar|nr:barstar family protein [Acholeplasmataceae bacterium]
MKKIILEIAEFTLPEQLHLYLQDALSLPADCETLDEIYDFLTDIDESMTIVLPQEVADDEHLGEYGERLLTVFDEAAAENPNLKVEVI